MGKGDIFLLNVLFECKMIVMMKNNLFIKKNTKKFIKGKVGNKKNKLFYFKEDNNSLG